MTLDEYIELMKVRIEDFERTWRNYHDDDPKNWPNEYEGSDDWNEQFDMLT